MRDFEVWLMKEFNMTSKNIASMNSRLAEIHKLPPQNPWRNFQTVFMWTLTVGSSLGYGNVVPITTGGKILCIFGGLIAVVLCLALFVEFYNLQMSLWKITVRWFEFKWPKLADKVSARTLDAVHACIVFCNIFLCSLIIFHVLHVNDKSWTFIDICYAYFQLWTTIGFGDFVFFADIEDLGYSNSVLLWLIFPIFMFGWALFPVLIVAMFNIVKDVLIRCFKPCCHKKTYKNMKSLTNLNGGIEMARSSIYQNYKKPIKEVQTARKSMKQAVPKVRRRVFSSMESWEDNLEIVSPTGSCKFIPWDDNSMHSNPCVTTPNGCVVPVRVDSVSVWTVNDDNELTGRKATLREKCIRSRSLKLLTSKGCATPRFRSDPTFNSKFISHATSLPEIRTISNFTDTTELSELPPVSDMSHQSTIASESQLPAASCFMIGDSLTDTEFESVHIDPLAVSN